MGFNINAFLNEESRKNIKSDWKPLKVDVRKLRPSPEKTNFYHVDDKEIKDLAESIELIGLQQYPVVRPIEGTDEYEVIAGHRRRLALLRLLDEGKNEYEMVPCRVETPDDIRNEMILIFTNSTQRERTDYEKMREIERVRELLTEYQKTHDLAGRKQDIIAGILGTNKTKVGTLDNINNNLAEPFREEFAAGKISTSAANEIAGLEPAGQQVLYETYKTTGTLTAKDAKALKEVFHGDLPEESVGVISECRDRAGETPQEAPKEAENTSEPETKVTYNAPAPDITDRKSLVINGRINMTDREKEIIKSLNHSLFTVEYLEEWINRDDNVFANAPAALQAMHAKGYYEAIKRMADKEGSL